MLCPPTASVWNHDCADKPLSLKLLQVLVSPVTGHLMPAAERSPHHHFATQYTHVWRARPLPPLHFHQKLYRQFQTWISYHDHTSHRGHEIIFMASHMGRCGHTMKSVFETGCTKHNKSSTNPVGGESPPKCRHEAVMSDIVEKTDSLFIPLRT